MKSSFVKDFISVSLSRASVLILGLLKSVALARALGPEKNGIIAALSLYPTLFMSIGSLGIGQAVTFLVGKDVYPINDIKFALLKIWVFTSLFCSVFCFLLIKLLSNVSEDNGLIFLAVLPIFSNLFITYNQGLFLGQNRISEYNKINWLPNLIVFISTIFFVVIVKLDVAGAMMSLIPGPLIMLFLVYRRNFKNFELKKIRSNIGVLQHMLRLGMVYAFSLIIISLNYKIAIIMLDHLSTTYELGIYSKGAQLAEYLWQIPTLLSTIVFARSASSKDQYAFSLKVAQLLRLSLLFVGIGFSFLFWLSPYLIRVLFGNEFSDSSDVIRMLLPGVLIMTMYKVLNMDLAGKGRPSIAIYAMLPAVVINVLLSLWLIPKFGAKGGGVASSISYCIASLLFLYYYLRVTGLRFSELLVFKRLDFIVFLEKMRRK